MVPSSAPGGAEISSLPQAVAANGRRRAAAARIARALWRIVVLFREDGIDRKNSGEESARLDAAAIPVDYRAPPRGTASVLLPLPHGDPQAHRPHPPRHPR